ncbi:MAG: hypothetical protein ACRD4J_03780, partial [Nitrososphaeraceae archaeon]
LNVITNTLFLINLLLSSLSIVATAQLWHLEYFMMASSAYFDGGRLIKLNLDPIKDKAALAILDRFGPEWRSNCLNSSATILGTVKCKLPRNDSILSIFRNGFDPRTIIKLVSHITSIIRMKTISKY